MSSLLTETYEGAPGGMNLAVPSQEIPDTQVRYLQDAMLHRPGEINRRGPVQGISGVATTRKPATGLLQTLDPNGNLRIAVLFGDGTEGKLGLYSSDLSTMVEANWNGVLPTSPDSGSSSAYRVVDSKAALTGGCWIGSSSQYDANSPVQSLALWRGANKADYSTGTTTFTKGSTAVTGAGTSWLTTLTAGMYFFANTDDPYTNAYVGIVKSIQTNTSLTLAAVSPYTGTAKAYVATSLRGFCPRVVTGRITTSTANTAVTGATTKFADQGMASGAWDIYRASDFGFVGHVSSVTNNTAITLSANAALSLSNERYIALRADGDYSVNTQAVTGRKVGFLNAIYAERQWYANLGQDFPLTSRVWFSDATDPEAVDLSPFDGDFIDVGSSSSQGINTPIKSLTPAYNALVIHKEDETFGVFGSSKSDFEVKKIEDDGTLSGMSVQAWGGGVIWAGRNGIYFYDGIQADNLTDACLGDYYRNAIRSFDPTQYRMWSFMERNHYFLFLEKFQPNVAVVKGMTSSTPTRITFVLNMDTKAMTTLTNVSFRGAIRLPAASGETTWYLANSSTNGFICDSADLFDQTGVDAFGCDGGTAGPDFYMESKKYKVGDSLRKKLFKQLAVHYLAQGGGLQVDTVVGLNNIGQTSATVFPATVYTWDTLPSLYPTWDSLAAAVPTWDSLIVAVYLPKRIKFLKRSQHMAFRIYQQNSSVTRVVLGPFQLAFKLQRPGRI